MSDPKDYTEISKALFQCRESSNHLKRVIRHFRLTTGELNPILIDTIGSLEKACAVLDTRRKDIL